MRREACSVKSFAPCLCGELKKLAVRKKYLILTIVMAAVSAALTMLLMLAKEALSRESLSVTVNISMTLLPIFASAAVPLIGIMAVCDLFASEYHSTAIKAQLLRPVTRFKIYTAKLTAAWLMCALVMLAEFVVTALCSVFAGGGSGLWYAFGAYILDILPEIILILMAALINQCTKSPTSAMFLSIIIYLAAKLSGYVSASGGSMLFTSYMEWHRLWLGTALPMRDLLTKCALLFGYGLTFFSGGYLLFLKKEF